jgi:substrate import-associated zinc metallohydrolase lipoprotein
MTLGLSVAFISCGEDDLSSTSVIKDSQKEENDFDRWIAKYYVAPYNIDLKYRMEDIESDMNYFLVPADYHQSVRMAKLMKFLCFEAYDEVTGSKKFIRDNYPKLIHLIGSAAYRNNGTMILGTAEGGMKISMYYVNALQLNPTFLNTYYFKTMHHEFTHILNQTKPYSIEFDMISGSNYVKDGWNSKYASNTTSLKDGFITPYASSEPREDFAELLSVYVTNTAAQWSQMLTTAGTTGSGPLQQKFDIVYNYMLDLWDIDLNQVRTVVQRRQGEISTLDLDNLEN